MGVKCHKWTMLGLANPITRYPANTLIGGHPKLGNVTINKVTDTCLFTLHQFVLEWVRTCRVACRVTLRDGRDTCIHLIRTERCTESGTILMVSLIRYNSKLRSSEITLVLIKCLTQIFRSKADDGDFVDVEYVPHG